ncbi:DMT family protein [Actinokineospora iranica]|uniref:Magnesium transporter NIPA n=1 Tax=Actinokineospora iranica TaxID=1271860 RepID=A0A1G6K0V4_9PSEU|nr:hypothetical protein [Actinokineospora iranica]SDC24265.1 hypothetical protein SAMN05216174_101641 [Actinokineospora iranica]
MTDLIIAVALCVAVAVAYATAALIQARHAHLSMWALIRLPVWWAAFGLNALGAALHVLSLGFGPLSLIQPLGVLTLVIAVPLTAATARRGVTRTETVGMVCTVIGLVGLTLLVTTGGDGDTLADHELTGLLLATAAIVGLLTAQGQRAGASPLWEAVAGGLAFAVCSALCQTVVLRVQASGATALAQPATIVAIISVAVLAIAATVTTQRSYRDGLGAPLAVTNLVNPTSATAIGIVFLGEELATTGLEIALAVGCAVIAAYGVTQLARARDLPVAAPLLAIATDDEARSDAA